MNILEKLMLDTLGKIFQAKLEKNLKADIEGHLGGSIDEASAFGSGDWAQSQAACSVICGESARLPLP